MRRSPALLLALSALAVGLGACATGPLPPLSQPPGALVLDHYQGSLLSGPHLSVEDADVGRPRQGPARESWVVDVRIGLARGLDESALERLSSTAPLIAQPLSGAPLRGIEQMLVGSRSGLVDEPEEWIASSPEWLEVDRLTGVLDRGMTCVVGAVDLAGDPRPLELHVHRPDEGDSALAGLIRLELDEYGATAAWELVIVDERPRLEGRALVLTLPMAESTERFVIVVSLRPPTQGDPRHAEVVGRARQQAYASWRELQALVEAVRAGVPDRTGLLEALSGLTEEGNRRGALIYLSGATGSEVALDLALSGRVELLEALAAAIREADPGASEASLTELAWLIERATLAEIARRVENVEEDDPRLEAMLIRHVGEVGRDLPLLLGLLEEAGEIGRLRHLLVEENLHFLDDNAPASRVRAVDWLLAQGVEIPGYRALGEKSQRRDALDAFYAAREAEAATGTAP